MNWDWEINCNLETSFFFYGSAGRGGGNGPRGNNYRSAESDILPFRKDLYQHIENGRGSRNDDGTIDYDAEAAANQNNTSGYTGAISDFVGQRIGSNGFRDSNVNREILIRRR